LTTDFCFLEAQLAGQASSCRKTSIASDISTRIAWLALDSRAPNSP